MKMILALFTFVTIGSGRAANAHTNYRNLEASSKHVLTKEVTVIDFSIPGCTIADKKMTCATVTVLQPGATMIFTGRSHYLYARGTWASDAYKSYEIIYKDAESNMQIGHVFSF